MEQYFSILQCCPLFQGIDRKDLSGMLTCLGGQVEHFEKKQTVAAEGTPAEQIGVLLSGEVQIEQTDYYGNRSILAKLGPGDLFGETFACAGAGSLPVDVMAVEDCTVLLIRCSRILTPCTGACGFHQRLIYNLMKGIAAKNVMLQQKIQITSKRSTREKLLAYLNLQAKRAGSHQFSIPYDRQELADYLQVERSGLSAEIGKLRREGILTSEKNRFTLL